MTAAPPFPTTQILLFEGFDELDAVGPFEVLRAAGFEVQLVTVDGATADVRGGHGLRVGVDGALDEHAGGLLVVPGGGFAAGPTGAARVVIAAGVIPSAVGRMHAAGTTVASVCTGGAIIASAGLLQGRPAITHRAALDYLREQGADVREAARVVDDGDLITAGGVTAGLDLALHLVERYAGPEAATRGALRIEHERTGQVLVTTKA